MEIDHVVLAARDRADAERELDAAGLGIARGRVIPGTGLSNLVVPLGFAALEIQFPNGEEPAPGAPPFLALDRVAFARWPGVPLIPVAWLLAVEDVAALRRQASVAGMPVMDVPATGPQHPAYTLAGLGATYERRWLPYLIHWPVPVAERPGALPAAHRRRPSGITRIDVSGPAGEIRDWCGADVGVLRTVPGTDGPVAVEVGFEDGGPPVTFGAAS